MGKVAVDEPLTRRAEGAAAADLAQVSIARILFDKYAAAATGAMLLARDDSKKIVYLRSGYPISVKSNVRAECLGKILVWDGLISREQWRDSLLVMRQSGKRQGSVLIEMGALSPLSLTRGLELQYRFRLGEVFSWAEGTCRFWSGVRPPPEMASFEIAPVTLIHDGVRTFMSGQRVYDDLSPLLNHFLIPSPNPLWRFQALDISLKAALLLDRIDGTTTIADLLRSSPLSASDTHALIYTLLCTWMVSPSEFPSQSWASMRLPRIAKDRAVGAPQRTRHGDLARMVERLRRSQPYEVLGVPPGASLPTVRLAFQKRAGERHPDRVGASHAEGLRDLAVEALDLTARAFAKLAPDYDVFPPSAEMSVKTRRHRREPLAPDEPLDQPPAMSLLTGDAVPEEPLAPDEPLDPDEILAQLPTADDDPLTAARPVRYDDVESPSFDVDEVLAPDDADGPDAYIEQPTFAGPHIRPDQFIDMDDTLTPGQPLAEELAEALGALEGFREHQTGAIAHGPDGDDVAATDQGLEEPGAETAEAPDQPDRVPDTTDEYDGPAMDGTELPEVPRPPQDRTLDDRVWQIIEAEQYHQTGLKLLDLGRFDEAVRVLAHSVNSYDEEGEFRVSLAWALFQAGLDEDSAAQALVQLDEAVLRSPSARANLFRGHIFRFLERRDEAIWAYQEALRHDPENEEARSELDRIVESSRRS